MLKNKEIIELKLLIEKTCINQLFELQVYIKNKIKIDPRCRSLEKYNPILSTEEKNVK
jgi:hypothetical protein